MNDWERLAEIVNKMGLLPFLGGLAASLVAWVNTLSKRKNTEDMNSIKVLNKALEERDKNYNFIKAENDSLREEIKQKDQRIAELEAQHEH